MKVSKMRNVNKWFKLIVLTAVVFATAGHAEDAAVTETEKSVTTETTTTTTTTESSTGTVSDVVAVPSASDSKILGTVEVRPSWNLRPNADDAFSTENMVELGYQFNKNFSLSYRQEINTNLFNPAVGPSEGGLGAYANDGILRAKIDNIYVNEAAGLSFSYEPRVYLPTNREKRDSGMVTTVRNYLKLKKSLSDTVFLSLNEIPIVHAYDRAVGVKGANPTLENRVYLILDWNITDKLAFSFPLMLNSVKYRDAGPVTAGSPVIAKSNEVQHTLWIYPELTYAVTPNVSLGVAYYSDNLARTDLSALTIGDGLEKGVPQAVVNVTL